VIVGYCCTGRTVNETRPARQIMTDITVAKIGRSMKNLENIGQIPLSGVFCFVSFW
jgi:hypothetical protein